jgi:hypothetical protein
VAANAKAYVTQSNLASFVLDGNGLWNGLIVEVSDSTPPPSNSLAIGDTGPAGGKIFITPQTAGNTTGLYFEVAPVDVSNTRYTFCNQTNQLISGTLNSGIGYGESNTAAMIDWGCTSGAAVATSDYSLGGYDDWFLPSQDELKELYTQRKLFADCGTGKCAADLAASTYWSSSHGGASDAVAIDFVVGSDPLNEPQKTIHFVRPVRSFK